MECQQTLNMFYVRRAWNSNVITMEANT